jgi:phage N-6-adenine-methyltransferase
MNQIHFSSGTDDWATPQWLFDLLDTEFHFTVDVCAQDHNAKCARYFSPEDDGLKQDWQGMCCWCNPPYGRHLPSFIEKAWCSSRLGATVVCLIPARPDTRAWHRFVTLAHEIRFIKGRLKFGNAQNSAPFPSAIIVFRPYKREKDEPRVSFVDLSEVQANLLGS